MGFRGTGVSSIQVLDSILGPPLLAMGLVQERGVDGDGGEGAGPGVGG